MKNKDETTLSLLSNFTHQVINPLNGVLGTLDNVLDGTVPKERIHTRLHSARGQLENTISLVRNLAFFAEYSAAYAEAEQKKAGEICVLPQLLIEGLQFYQEQGRDKLITIEVIDQHRQIAVRGNRALIRQVFMNIFDNGIKYGLRGAKLCASYWIQKDTKDAVIEIIGESVGFAHSENIFDLGARGSAARAATSSGSGLGLHICKLIVENVFRGKIDAEYSKASRKTKFVVHLPGAFVNE